MEGNSTRIYDMSFLFTETLSLESGKAKLLLRVTSRNRRARPLLWVNLCHTRSRDRVIAGLV